MTLNEMNLRSDLQQLTIEVAMNMKDIIRTHRQVEVMCLAGMVYDRIQRHNKRTDADNYDNGHFARSLSSYLRTLDHLMADFDIDGMYRSNLPSWSTWAMNLYKQYGKIVSL